MTIPKGPASPTAGSDEGRDRAARRRRRSARSDPSRARIESPARPPEPRVTCGRPSGPLLRAVRPRRPRPSDPASSPVTSATTYWRSRSAAAVTAEGCDRALDVVGPPFADPLEADVARRFLVQHAGHVRRGRGGRAPPPPSGGGAGSKRHPSGSSTTDQPASAMRSRSSSAREKSLAALASARASASAVTSGGGAGSRRPRTWWSTVAFRSREATPRARATRSRDARRGAP